MASSAHLRSAFLDGRLGRRTFVTRLSGSGAVVTGVVGPERIAGAERSRTDRVG